MNNPQEQIKQKMDQLFSDTSRPASETLEHLICVKEHAEELIQVLEDDSVEADRTRL